MDAETPLGALVRCGVGGAVGGTSSAMEAERSRARLNADTSMTGEQLLARLKQIANKYSQMSKYLDSEYGIKLE
jgi:predicted NBD/HSP70 family sugar kinase